MRFAKYLCILRELCEDVDAAKQGRADFIKKTYLPRLNDIHGFKSIDGFIDTVANADPTKNGAYMPWIAKLLIKNPEENKVEDLHRLKDDLIAFGTYKNKIENKDVNSYKSFHDVYAAIEPFTVKRPKTADEKKAEKKEAKLMQAKDGIVDVYSGPEGWIKIPTTKAASQFIGQSTRWCTAAKGKNMFDHYNESDSLFVIYDKTSKARTQLHIKSGSYNDVADKPLGIEKVPEWARAPIAKWYKEKGKELGVKHIMTLASFGQHDVAKGTDHEEMMDLMRKHGVI